MTKRTNLNPPLMEGVSLNAMVTTAKLVKPKRRFLYDGRLDRWVEFMEPPGDAWTWTGNLWASRSFEGTNEMTDWLLETSGASDPKPS